MVYPILHQSTRPLKNRHLSKSSLVHGRPLCQARIAKCRRERWYLFQSQSRHIPSNLSLTFHTLMRHRWKLQNGGTTCGSTDRIKDTSSSVGRKDREGGGGGRGGRTERGKLCSTPRTCTLCSSVYSTRTIMASPYPRAPAPRPGPPRRTTCTQTPRILYASGGFSPING
jgi:hypothetical protein